jgi:methyl-accepting chemotaxis protein
MNLVQLSKIGDKVKFIFRELNEAYDSDNKKYIIRVQDLASSCLFWYYLEMGATLREYQEEADKMLDEEKERTEIVELIEKLRDSFNEMGDDLREIVRAQRKSGLTNAPD